MASLIDELKADHAMLLSELDAARSVNLDPVALKEVLDRARAHLLSHLGKEDARFYPALDNAAQQDPRLQAMLSLFRTEMTEIAREVNEFFQRLDTHGFGDDFVQAVGKMTSRLRARITREERMLYPEFERLKLVG